MNTSRRVALKGLAAISILPFASKVFAAGETVKIGYVAPLSGPLGSISEADPFVIEKIREHFGGQINVNGQMHPLEIIVKDTQSDATRAADVASDLILRDEVVLILVGSTPDTTNPVADQCEINGVPCISTATPWQPWFFGRGGVPGKTVFKWTNHYFWGAEDLTEVYLDIWNRTKSSKVIGSLWPNDPDGIAFADKKLGFPPALESNGYTLVDPGRYQNLKDDFSSEIRKFKAAGVEIITGVMLPPDLATFMVQAKQQGFSPKVVTVAKAALTPAGVASFPDGLGKNLTSEYYWGPQFPLKSSLTGQSAEQLANSYTKETGRAWLQGIGYTHSLFEVAADVLSRSASTAPEDVISAVNETNLDTIVGHVKWGDFAPFMNVSKTPVAAGQWQVDEKGEFELKLISNTHYPDSVANAELQQKTW